MLGLKNSNEIFFNLIDILKSYENFNNAAVFFIKQEECCIHFRLLSLTEMEIVFGQLPLNCP